MGRNPAQDRIKIEQTRAKLMQAGRAAILDKGLQKVRVRDIVDLADLGVGTFYFHFKDLEQFQTEVIRQAMEELRALIREVRGLRDQSVLQDPENSIRKSFAAFYDLIDTTGPVSLMLIRERSGTGALAQFIRKQFELFAADLREDLETAAKYDLVPKNISYDLAAKAILGMNLQLAEGYAERRFAEAGASKQARAKLTRQAAEDRERIVTTLTRITLHGLLTPAMHQKYGSSPDAP